MPRVLTATRVAVAADDVDAWLATLEVLAARRGGRGPHLWVFRAEGEPEAWLEFSEGPDPATHRSAGPADQVEAALEATLRRLGRYDPVTTATRWHEVSLVQSPEE